MAGGKGIPYIASETCKGCGLCVFVCPESVLCIDDTVVNSRGYHPAAVADPERCIACISCALMCPDTAITVERFSRSKGG
ncbi:MAG: 4Fe-4S binding protein [Desulfofustis sp.]|jgi:2-oxoglutarate ferredoxin oxidoreductase subunit delta|nr:4Fe-4S binding protein [Desulfofustis sp.]